MSVPSYSRLAHTTINYIPGAFGAPGAPGAPGALGAPGAPGAFGAPGAGGLPMSDGSTTTPGIPGALASGISGSTLLKSAPQFGHVKFVASDTCPHSGHVLFNTKLVGLKHIQSSSLLIHRKLMGYKRNRVVIGQAVSVPPARQSAIAYSTPRAVRSTQRVLPSIFLTRSSTSP